MSPGNPSSDPTERSPSTPAPPRPKASKCPCCGHHTLRPTKKAHRVCRYRIVVVTLPAWLLVPTCSRCKHSILSFDSVPELAATLEAAYRAELVHRASVEITHLGRLYSQRLIERELDLSQGYLSRLRAGDSVPSAALVSLLALLRNEPQRLAELSLLGASHPRRHAPAKQKARRMTVATEDLQALSSQTRTLLTKLSPWAAQAPGEFQPAWTEHMERLAELAQFLEAGGAEPAPARTLVPVTAEQWVQFGRLLRDKRNAAGFSRVQLARRAKISDATIKFIETARHPPSRATLIRLIGVSDLKLRWPDVPGHPEPPAPESPALGESPRPRGPLNCLLAPSHDPLSLHAELTSFLQGAGGYLEQTHAYLEPGSAAAYRTLCRTWLPVARLRSLMPLGEIAQQIVSVSGDVPLQLLALGAGDGQSETQLTGCLIEAGAASIELCLLDISPPLLTAAYHHAVSHLASLPQVHIWALQGNFHHLSGYAALHRPAAQPRRLITMLGETLAHLDHEPRFLQQSLMDCHRDDLLLLDLAVAPASCDDPALIPRHDRLFAGGVPAPYATWLGQSLWRHCPQAEQIDFHWELIWNDPSRFRQAVDPFF